MTSVIAPPLTYPERIEQLRATKLRRTQEKVRELGASDMDDLPIQLPPAAARKMVRGVNASGVMAVDALFKDFVAKTDHPSGGIFGARACGENFRALLDLHPPCIDPASSLAGGYMSHFTAYRQPAWRPEFDYSHLHALQQKYKLHHGVGAIQHFCQDQTIGLTQGWGGILARIRHYRTVNRDDEAQELYDGLEHFVLATQAWIGRHATAAREMAAREDDPVLRRNLEDIAAISDRLVAAPPQTFREACQWTLYYQLAGKVYNMAGALGRIDQFLYPFFERDKKAGTLTDEEAVFHLSCYFLRDTSYTQIGGPDADGRDLTNPLSHLVLEAAHRIRIPVNVGVSVGRSTDPQLLRRGVEILFTDRTGTPKFLGVDNTSAGFARNGYPIELGRLRAYSGCHWCAIPGREYTVNDCVKVNLAAVFEVAFKDLMSDPAAVPSVDALWHRYEQHLRCAVETVGRSLDFHLDHMYGVFPELHLDLLCHGPIERGRDASHGGVEFYNLCVDAAGLATVADSFAAVEQRVDREGQLTWSELNHWLETSWAGPEGEQARLLMKGVPRFGSGNSRADHFGVKVARSFTAIVKEKPTPHGYNLIPGIFSWAATITMGKDVGATPNGRYAQGPISHGPNPDPGFRRDAAPTALALTVAAVQPGYGNTAPMQIELDPGLSRTGDGIDQVVALVRGHFALGGTQINMNILDKQKLLEANRDPSTHPDLVVRVTGFSAYFASLSPEMRQMVVDRVITQE